VKSREARVVGQRRRAHTAISSPAPSQFTQESGLSQVFNTISGCLIASCVCSTKWLGLGENIQHHSKNMFKTMFSVCPRKHVVSGPIKHGRAIKSQKKISQCAWRAENDVGNLFMVVRFNCGGCARWLCQVTQVSSKTFVSVRVFLGHKKYILV
jgi:hypothetical protein